MNSRTASRHLCCEQVVGAYIHLVQAVYDLQISYLALYRRQHRPRSPVLLVLVTWYESSDQCQHLQMLKITIVVCVQLIKHCSSSFALGAQYTPHTRQCFIYSQITPETCCFTCIAKSIIDKTLELKPFLEFSVRADDWIGSQTTLQHQVGV